MRSRQIAIVLALCVIASAMWIGYPALAQSKTYRKGDKVADFTLPDLGGKKVKLSQFKGKPILINFFALW